MTRRAARDSEKKLCGAPRVSHVAKSSGTHLLVELAKVVLSLDLRLLDGGMLLELVGGRHLHVETRDISERYRDGRGRRPEAPTLTMIGVEKGRGWKMGWWSSRARRTGCVVALI